MKESTRKKLMMQGFCMSGTTQDIQTGKLARWTPLSCAAFGAGGLAIGSSIFLSGALFCPCAIAGITGIWLNSGWFFIVLGLLTLTGGITNRSIYDRLYNVTISKIFKTTPIPKHGAPRKFGCFIGGLMYMFSGVGFLLGNMWMAIIPAIFMIVLATLAGLSQWCFASAIYQWTFNKNKI